jgi:predicted Zn-dependent peptidase
MIDNLEAPVDRASALAHATLFDGNPDSVNRVPTEIAAVTPEQVQQFVKKYLVPTNRTIIERDPAPGAGEESKKPEEK